MNGLKAASHQAVLEVEFPAEDTERRATLAGQAVIREGSLFERGKQWHEVAGPTTTSKSLAGQRR